MPYLYGDATPFPIDENFIETLSALTEACVGLFRVENAAHERDEQIAAARAACERDIAELGKLAQAIEPILAGFAEAGIPTAASTTAQLIAGSAREALTEATRRATSTRDQAIQSANALDVAGDLRRAVSPFFAHHQLPGTSFGAKWRYRPSTERSEATIFGRTPDDIELALAAAIPTGSFWAQPLRVADCDASLSVQLSKEGGLLGKSTKTRREGLHKLVVVEVERTAGRRVLILASPGKKSGPGLSIVWSGSGDCRICRVDNTDDGAGDGGERMRGENQAATDLLWSWVEKRVPELIATRSTLSRIRYESDDDCEVPGELAETLLRAVAPFVREMRKRSRVPGELALKRDLGDGRREELFVPRAELCAKYAELPDSQRRAFEAAGLSNEPTQEFVTTMLPAPEEGAFDEEDELTQASAEPRKAPRPTGPPPPPPPAVKREKPMNLDQALAGAGEEPGESTVETPVMPDKD